MKLARVQTETGPVSVVERGGVWESVEDIFAGELTFTGQQFPLTGISLLAPVRPTVLVGISHNLGNNDHSLPIQAFLKSPRTIANPHDEVPLRADIGSVNMEVELAIVIGQTAKHLTLENALDCVFGYTIGNDVTNVDQVTIDEKFTQVKNGENYTPLGPWIETDLVEPGNRRMEIVVNNEVRRVSSTALLPSGLAEVLVYLTEWMELGPGDVILSGAPNTSVPVESGDVVECMIEGLGTLTSKVS